MERLDEGVADRDDDRVHQYRGRDMSATVDFEGGGHPDTGLQPRLNQL